MSDRKKILIATVGAGVLIMGGLGWLCWTDWQEREALRREAQDLEAKISRAEVEIKSVADVEKRVLVLRNRLKSHVAILPDDEKINGFVDKLTEFAKKAQVTIESLDDSSARRLRRSRQKAKEAFERVTYKLTIRANTDRLLRFLDLFENHYERFVRIPSFKIERETNMRDASPELPLTVQLQLETYVYNPKAKGYEQVPIRNEAAKLERLRREGLLTDADTELDLAVYDFSPKPYRRDPFVDPRVEAAGAANISAQERQAQLEQLEDLRSRLEEIHEMIAKESEIENSVQRFQAQARTNDAIRKLGEDVLRLAKEEFFTVKDFAEEFHVDIELPYNHLRDSRQLGPVGIRLEDVSQTVAEMKQNLAAGRYDQVLALHGQLAEMQKVPVTDQALVKAFQEADEIKARAEAHKEFLSMRITLGGCICYGDDPDRSVAIINNRSFSPGEMVVAGLRVKKITPEAVTFDFKGVTVSRRFEEGTTH